MKFLYYRVAGLISKKLGIKLTSENENLQKFGVSQKGNPLFIALYINKDSYAKFIEEQTQKNFDEMINVDSVSNSKKYATGDRSIPDDTAATYSDMNIIEFETMKSRFDFFVKMVQSESNIGTVIDELEMMVMDASNLLEEKKKEILSAENDGIFERIRETCKKDKEKQLLRIFKILAYSVQYSEVKTAYDELSSKAVVHPKYIDRSDIIGKLNEAFESNQQVFLCGIRGSGKTEISRKFISENNFYGVITLYYCDDFLDSIESEELFAKSKNKLTNKELICGMDKKYLLVVENVTESLPDDVLEFLDSCKCKVLVISSYRPRHDRCTIVDVTKLSEEQAESMINTYDTSNTLTAEQKSYIVKKLNYHSLAVTVYAKAIGQSCLIFEEIKAILKKSVVSDEISEVVNWENNEKIAGEHIRTLFVGTMKNLNKESQTILRAMALMPASGVSCSCLQKLTGIKNNNSINRKLIPMGWVSMSNDAKKIVTIHSIIRDIVVDELKPNTENCKSLMNILYNRDRFDAFYKENVEYRKVYFSVLNNICFNGCEDLNKAFEVLLDSMHILSFHGYIDETKYLHNKMIILIDLFKDHDKELILEKYEMWKSYIDLYVIGDFNQWFEKHELLFACYCNELDDCKKFYGNNEFAIELIEFLVSYLRGYIDVIINLTKDIEDDYLLSDVYSKILKVKYLFQEIKSNYECKNSSVSEMMRGQMVNVEYCFLLFCFWHDQYTKLLDNIKFEISKERIRKYNKPNNYKVLRLLYEYYVFCKKQNLSGENDAKETAIDFYISGGFANYNYDKVKDIAEGLGLLHSQIDSLEDDE